MNISHEDCSLLRETCDQPGKQGSFFEQNHDLSKLPKKVDVVYTTRWETMGVKHKGRVGGDSWKDKFVSYKVNEKLMEQVSGKQTLFMHDLPAMRGQDVTNEVLDGPQFVAFRQAKHKMTAARAIL